MPNMSREDYREEDEIIDSMNDGRISQEEGQRRLRALKEDYRADAEEAAKKAYDDEMERWI